ncbi:MAG: hypothetical protein V1859_04365 [archaeon]
MLLFTFFILISFANAEDIKQKIESASSDVTDFFNDVEHENVLIVTGKKISVEDKILFNLIKSNIQIMQAIEVENDEIASKNMPYNGKTLILLGSEKTNIMSKKILGEDVKKNTSRYSPLILEYVITGNNDKALIIYSEKEVENNENSAVSKSPLSKIIDKKYVPIAATTASVLLLYLWSIIGKTLMSLFNDFVSSKVLGRATKDKKVSEHKKNRELKIHKLLSRNEIIALILSILIFSVTMSFAWSKNLPEFVKMLLLNFVIVAAVTLIRELFRQAICFKQKIKTEYMLWPFGAALTLISTYLGNTFSLVSYTLVDDTITDEKKFGKLAFLISLVTFIAGFIAYVINIFVPSLVMQMIFVYCIMAVFIEFFPMAPFAGNDMRKWNFTIWLVGYLVVFASYVFTNFTIYV